MKILATLRYAVRVALWPGKTTGELLDDPDRLRHGVAAWLIVGFIYGSVAMIGGLNGLGPTVEPFLPISSEKYYLWMGVFTPLIYLVNFLILAGLIQLLTRLAGGQGHFEDTFTVVALTFFTPVLLTMWVFEMPILVFFPSLRRSELGGFGYMPEWLDTTRQVVGVLWILVTLIVAVAQVHRISKWKSLVITIIASIPAWAVMLTYLR